MTQSEARLGGQAEGKEGNTLKKKKGLRQKLEMEVLILYFGG